MEEGKRDKRGASSEKRRAMSKHWKAIVLLLALASESVVAKESAAVRREKTTRRELQNEGVEAYYVIFALLVSECGLPTSVTYLIECSGSGSAVALDDSENLGQAKCTSINRGTLQCVEDSFNTSGRNGATMKCVGDTQADVQVTATVAEETVNCFFQDFAVYTRSLSVLRVCIPIPALPTDFRFFAAERPNCSVNSILNGGNCETSFVCGGFGNPPCSSQMPLPAITYQYLDTVVPENCLFTDGLVPPGFTSPSLKDAPGNTAEYFVTFASTEDNDGACLLDFPLTASLTCGEKGKEGAINLLPESQPALDNGICQRQGTSTITCSFDPVNLALEGRDIATATYVSCTGTSVEALAVMVELSPGKLRCSFDSFGSYAYSTAIYQRCTGIKTTPFGDFSGLTNVRCFPVGSSKIDLFDTDGDNENDTGTKQCLNLHGNCLSNFVCEADGSQQVATIGSSIPPHVVDLDCLVPGDPGVVVVDPSCVDNAKKKNIFFGIPVNGKERDCSWLSNTSNKNQKWYCTNEKQARRRCAACGTVTAQEENPMTKIAAYKVQKRNCGWLEGRNDVAELCQLSKDARKFCKKTCGRCS